MIRPRGATGSNRTRRLRDSPVTLLCVEDAQLGLSLGNLGGADDRGETFIDLLYTKPGKQKQDHVSFLFSWHGFVDASFIGIQFSPDRLANLVSFLILFPPAASHISELE